VTLAQFTEWLTPLIDYGEQISMGKINAEKEKAVCLYSGTPDEMPVMAIGGAGNSSYDILPVQILIRWTKYNIPAEKAATDVFGVLSGTSFLMGEKRCFILMRCQRPIPLGTDDNGVFEYLIRLNVYFER